MENVDKEIQALEQQVADQGPTLWRAALRGSPQDLQQLLHGAGQAVGMAQRNVIQTLTGSNHQQFQ